MRLTCLCNFPRRFLNSPYDISCPLPKKSKWLKKERLWRWTAWSLGDRRDTKPAGHRERQRIWQWETEKRKDEYNYQRHWANERLKAALAEHRMEYKFFKPMLDKAHILLNNETLSKLAVWEPRTFKSLVMLAKQMCIENGTDMPLKPAPENIYTREKLHGEAYPSKNQYRRGRPENWTDAPRPLKTEDF